MVKIISWNVNGIRAVLKKGFIESVKEMNPDILCLQETKAHPEQVDHELKNLGYEYEYWNSAEKKGYSGTAVFSKIKPISVSYGLGIEKHDTEGRVITCEFEKYFLVTVYTPNSKRGLERLEYREKEWDVDFLQYVKTLEQTKPVVFCGDLNVAHQEIDLKNPQSNKTTKTKPGNAGFTDQERRGFDNIVNAGFIDTFRYLHPNEEKYTWWSYMFQARKKNIGWRIDYFCVSQSLKDAIQKAEILDHIMGSDHCPVELELNI
jgi:exodeoxyribonuclease-3